MGNLEKLLCVLITQNQKTHELFYYFGLRQRFGDLDAFHNANNYKLILLVGYISLIVLVKRESSVTQHPLFTESNMYRKQGSLENCPTIHS